MATFGSMFVEADGPVLRLRCFCGNRLVKEPLMEVSLCLAAGGGQSQPERGRGRYGQTWRGWASDFAATSPEENHPHVPTWVGA